MCKPFSGVYSPSTYYLARFRVHMVMKGQLLEATVVGGWEVLAEGIPHILKEAARSETALGVQRSEVELRTSFPNLLQMA